MRVVTVARKPCVETSTTANVLVHSCGALNIDGTRIAGAVWTRGTETIEDIRGGRYGTASKDRVPAGSREMPGGGRWPANVVLIHELGCEVVGERSVSTGTAHREKSGGKTIFSETDKKPLPNMTYGKGDGKETVLDWRCTHGCPVASLDGQSGILTSGSGAVKRASSAGRRGNTGATYGAESRPEGSAEISYGDRGSASRFFKTIKP